VFSTFKARNDQLAVIASMESSEYYRCLDDPAFMSKFDVHMTYHRASEVPLLYWHQRYTSSLVLIGWVSSGAVQSWLSV
jgi:hypothetical protein